MSIWKQAIWLLAAAASAQSPRPVSGLMMGNSVPPITQENFIASGILELNWSQIETKQGSFNWQNTLDTGLASLRAAHVTNVKLRILSGGQAPPWAKRLGDANGYFNSSYYNVPIDCSKKSGSAWGGVAVQNVQGPTACIPFFWTPEYQTAYDGLMRALAARLNSNARYDGVSTVVDSSCMAVYAEVFYRGQGEGATNHTLSDAGLTPTNDWACQAAAIQTHKNAFGTRRRTAIAVNNWDLVQPTPQSDGSYRISQWYGGSQGPAGTYEFLQQVAVPTIGTTLLEVQNNGLHTNSACAAGGGPTSSYFCYIAQYPGRHGFQTQAYVPLPLSKSGASQTLLDDLVQGIGMNAQFIELPGGMTTNDWKLMPCFNKDVVKGTKTTCPQ